MRSTVFSMVQRKKKTAVSTALIAIVVGSLSGVYFTHKTIASPPPSRPARSIVNSNALASQLVGSQLQEAISTARSKLPSVNSNVRLISSRGISGSVSGTPLSTLEIAERIYSFETTALEPKMLNAMRSASAGESVASVESSLISSIYANENTYLNEALSNTVLDMMLLAKAKATNSVVPYSQAQSQAEKNYAQYVKSGLPALTLMHGQTAKDQFDSLEPYRRFRMVSPSPRCGTK